MKQKNSKKTLKQGFTLLELLVVVLIIGILAGIALPQYKMAVLKSRYNSIKALGKALMDAEERYLLNNGSYTPLIEDLDIEFPEQPTSSNSSGTGQKEYFFSWGSISLIDKRFDGSPRVLLHVQDISFQKWFLGGSSVLSSNRQYCRAQSIFAEKICQQETKKTTPTYSNNYGKWYSYN